MKSKISKWREQATRFQVPLNISDRAYATRLLFSMEPVLVGNVVLKVEPCGWPYPFNTGNQIFGENELGRCIQDDVDLDHGGAVDIEKMKLAIAWAEFQAADPMGAHDG